MADRPLEDAKNEARESPHLNEPSIQDNEIPRSSRPLRGWTAAHGYRDTEPSLWDRFRAWLGRLFRRKPIAEERTETDDDQSATVNDEVETSSSRSRSSFDDLDAPWGEPHAAEEITRRKSGELPHPDDFEAPWDDPYVGHETSEPDQRPPAASQHQAPPGESDPLWDEPRVIASSSPPVQAISRSDLDFVWSPPGPEDVDLLAEAKA